MATPIGRHPHPPERSPLLMTQTSSYGGEDHGHHPTSPLTTTDDILLLFAQKGTASAKNVAVNLTKTAAGTGILALPFACKEGGLVLFVVGTVGIAVWNVFCLKRLCDCLDLLLMVSPPVIQSSEQSRMTQLPPPPAGTATLGKVAYYALGETGLILLDIMLLILLSGIVIAYEVAILSFAKGTPFTTGSNLVDAMILTFLLVPLSIVDDMSNLSKLSRLGLVILAFAMLVIAGYGISGYDTTTILAEDSPFSLWPPTGLTGVSHWFGCVVFGFGIVPLTFNFRESMAEPEHLPLTALISMVLVAFVYIVTGIIMLYLYPDITDDVLSEIPAGGLATVTRLAMIVVVLATAPLLIVPCAEIVEGKIHHDGQVHPKTILLARTGLSLFTVAVSVMLPGFVAVLAFVGCFSVALVSFCIPPFLHMVLLYQQQMRVIPLLNQDSATYPIVPLTIDLVTFLFGLAMTAVTTLVTFEKMVGKDHQSA